MAAYQFADGRIAERWANRDDLGHVATTRRPM